MKLGNNIISNIRKYERAYGLQHFDGLSERLFYRVQSKIEDGVYDAFHNQIAGHVAWIIVSIR